MNLSAPEAAEFLALYDALLFYANRQLQVVPGITSPATLAKRPLQDTANIRDALYDHPELIGAFIAENPDHLDPDALAVVASWQQYVRGDFYVVRYLKDYAVFLDAGSPARAYGVLGLTHPIADIFPARDLPVHLQTVLLPFKGRIVYDGLARGYAISFGPGIRGSLNETYRAIRENEGVVESLGPTIDDSGAPAPGRRAGRQVKPRRPAEDLLDVLDRMQRDSERLRGTTTPLESRAFSLLRAAVALARAAVAEPEDTAGLARLTRRTGTTLTQLANTLDRARWRE